MRHEDGRGGSCGLFWLLNVWAFSRLHFNGAGGLRFGWQGAHEYTVYVKVYYINVIPYNINVKLFLQGFGGFQ